MSPQYNTTIPQYHDTYVSPQRPADHNACLVTLAENYEYIGHKYKYKLNTDTSTNINTSPSTNTNTP